MQEQIIHLVHFDTPLIFGVELSFLITGVAIVVTLSLGILFHLNGKGNATNKLLAYFCFTNVFYNLINYTTINPRFASVASLSDCGAGSGIPLSQSLYFCFETELWLIRLVMWSWPFMFPALILFAHIYPGKIFSVSKKRITTILIWFGVISVMGLTPFVFSGIDEMKAFEKGIIAPQPFIGGLFIYALSVFGSVIWSMIILWKKRKVAQGVERTYFQYLVGTLMLYFVLTIVFSFILPAGLENPSFVQYAPMFILPFVFACAYIILRHKFIAATRLVTTQFFITGFWLVLLMQVFLSDSFEQMLINTLIVFASIVFGYLVLRSIFEEMEQRGKVEFLNSQLNDFNINLRKKVDEQTKEVQLAYQVEKRARMEIEELSKAKDQFVLTTQHHLRTPLTIIKNYVDLLPNAIKEQDPHLNDFVARLQRSSTEILELVSELLEVSQVQAGVISLNLKPVELKPLIDTIVNDFQKKINDKHIQVKFEGDPSLWPFIDLDEERMKRAFSILIHNAVMYNTDSGEISFKGEEKEHPIEQGKKIFRLSIRDTGLGFTKGEIDKLFIQMFSRGDEAQRINPLGRGTGLVLAKSIVNAHKGKMWVISDGRGKGSTFFVELEV